MHSGRRSQRPARYSGNNDPNNNTDSGNAYGHNHPNRSHKNHGYEHDESGSDNRNDNSRNKFASGTRTRTGASVATTKARNSFPTTTTFSSPTFTETQIQTPSPTTEGRWSEADQWVECSIDPNFNSNSNPFRTAGSQQQQHQHQQQQQHQQRGQHHHPQPPTSSNEGIEQTIKTSSRFHPVLSSAPVPAPAPPPAPTPVTPNMPYDLDELVTEATPNTIEAGLAGDHALVAARSVLDNGGTKQDAQGVALSILLKGKNKDMIKDPAKYESAKNQAKLIVAMARQRASEPPRQSNLGQALDIPHFNQKKKGSNRDVSSSGGGSSGGKTSRSAKEQTKQEKRKKQNREPKALRLRIQRGSLAWVARGYKAIAPRIGSEKVYFPTLNARYKEVMDTPEHASSPNNANASRFPPRIVSVCIPCFNEESDALKRTIDSLQRQYLPRGVVLEIVVAVDGTKQISKSMAEYLRVLFGISVMENDSRKNPFVTFPQAQTVIVEQTAMGTSSRNVQSAAGSGPGRASLSLVIKRTNKRKVNSQRWWLFAHAKDTQCEFAFATDCGIIFDQKCLMLLLERMDREPDISGLTGYQRVMTAQMQGDGNFELFTDPLGYFLRQLQSYDFEMSQSTTKSLVDSFGFIPVLPGPCSLFRCSHFQGIVSEYFTLTTQPLSGDGSDIVLGNVQLAEDRFPPVLLTFRDKENPVETKRNRPRTGFEHDAIFYFEAEKPLGQLVKQRRRWINGAYMAGYWVLKEGWIGKANQGLMTKIGAMSVLFFEIMQGLLIRLITPATIACGVLFMVTIMPAIYYEDVEEMRAILGGKTVDSLLLTYGIAAGGGYLLIFAVFMFAHTPRAVPLDTGKGEVLYQIDPKSAYRPFLFFISFLANALVACMFFYVGVGVYRFIGWEEAPIYFKVLTSMIAFPYVVAMLDGIINSKRPSFRAILNLIWLTPLFMLSSIWFYVWFPSYASARISDLSWGNRAAHQEYASSEIARHRAYLGRVVSVSIVLCNFVTAGIILGVVNIVLSEFLTIVLFSLLGFNVLLHTVNVIDMIFRFFTTRLPHWLCGEPPPPLRLRAANVAAADDDDVEEDDEMTLDYTLDHYTVETSSPSNANNNTGSLPSLMGRHPTSETSSESGGEDGDDDDDDDDEESEEEDDDVFNPYKSRVQLYGNSNNNSNNRPGSHRGGGGSRASSSAGSSRHGRVSV